MPEISIHGRRFAYREAGDKGPTVLLVHGITNSSATWAPVTERLAARGLHVLAPDMAGHGDSERQRGDHSLGAHASILRDFLSVMEVDRATIVGHSLGGGLVMQFAYQFPEMAERMVLVASGGLGREVSLAIRAATLPFAEDVLGVATSRPVTSAVGAVGRSAGAAGHPSGRRHRGDPARARLAVRRGAPPRVRSDRQVGDHATRPARGRHRQALPDRRPAHPPGGRRARQGHPGRAHPGRGAAGARQPAGDLREQRPLPAPERAGAVRRPGGGVRQGDQAREVRPRDRPAPDRGGPARRRPSGARARRCGGPAPGRPSRPRSPPASASDRPAGGAGARARWPAGPGWSSPGPAGTRRSQA